jgi:hypothetical protein
VLTEEKLDDTGAMLEHTPRKSLKHLAQVTGVLKSSTRTATRLLKPSVKVGVWCSVSARRNDLPVFFNKTINLKKYLCVERTVFSTPAVICEL